MLNTSTYHPLEVGEVVVDDGRARESHYESEEGPLHTTKAPEVPEHRHRSEELKADESRMDPVAIVLLDHEWKSGDQAHCGE